MLHQDVLPLIASPGPYLPGLGTLGRPTAWSTGTQSVRYLRARAGKTFRRSDSGFHQLLAGSPVRVLEPYRGSEHVDWRTGKRTAAQRRVLVRTGLAEAIHDEISSGRLDGPRAEPIEIGGASDPYPSAERRFELTRSVLDVLCETRDLEISLTTRSPLVLRDQDILRKLDLRHSVTVTIPIATTAPSLAARIEPGVAAPRARLDAARLLAADGIAVRILCSPILPGINGAADELDPVFSAARTAGVIDVVGDAGILKYGNRRRLIAWLEDAFPTRLDSVKRALEDCDRDALLGTITRLRLTYGFPTFQAGRG